jgi:probable addiction module antidote protein
MAVSKNWTEHMFERLHAHPDEIPGYLTACLDEGSGAFLVGLRHAIEATSSMASTASRANVHRVSLYKMLGKSGNPTLASLNQVLNALGMRLTVAAWPVAKRAAKARSIQSG